MVSNILGFWILTKSLVTSIFSYIYFSYVLLFNPAWFTVPQ